MRRPAAPRNHSNTKPRFARVQSAHAPASHAKARGDTPCQIWNPAAPIIKTHRLQKWAVYMSKNRPENTIAGENLDPSSG